MYMSAFRDPVLRRSRSSRPTLHTNSVVEHTVGAWVSLVNLAAIILRAYSIYGPISTIDRIAPTVSGITSCHTGTVSRVAAAVSLLRNPVY